MKIITYIRKCNPKQLAEFLSSSYYSDLTFNLVFGNTRITEQAEELQKVVFHMEIPPVIRFDDTHYINVKTRTLFTYIKHHGRNDYATCSR